MTRQRTGAFSLTLVLLLAVLTFVRAGDTRAGSLGTLTAPPDTPRSDVIPVSAGIGIETKKQRLGLSPEQEGPSGYSQKRKTPAPQAAGPSAYARLKAGLDREISAGRTASAHRLLQSDPLGRALRPYDYDRLRGRVAAAYFHDGKLESALKVARAGAERSGVKAPYANWIAGMAFWRLGQPDKSLPYFERVAASPDADAWTRAAGAFWASRAATRARNPALSIRHLREAARHKYTFYGLIAARTLGTTPNFNWSGPRYTTEHKKILTAHPDAGRVFGMVARGRYSQADTLLRTLDTAPDSKLGQAVYAYALHAHLPGTALAHESAARTRGAVAGNDAGYYPLLRWVGEAAPKADPALAHAIIRQESRFKTGAESGQGALGLMQIMPGTAQFILASTGSPARAVDTDTIKNPKTNVTLGLRYVDSLLADPVVEGDLFALAVAYNAGPGNLARWQKKLSDVSDPLLFIESIPSAETRAFVERVLANYWIYSIRLSRPLHSLDAVAAGASPLHSPRARIAR